MGINQRGGDEVRVLVEAGVITEPPAGEHFENLE